MARFEKKHNCKVELLDVGSSGTLLQRLALAKDHVDVVVGLDQWSLREARIAFPWKMRLADAMHTINWDENIFPTWVTKDFMPFDWSPLTILHRNGESDPPKTLTEMQNSAEGSRLTLQDPRSSNLGMQFLYWIMVTQGSEAAWKYWAGLKKNSSLLSPSWSMSYGLFQKRTSEFDLFLFDVIALSLE